MAAPAVARHRGWARSWWSRKRDAVLERESSVPSVEELDTSVSFAELVWAHFKRQEDVFNDDHAGVYKDIRESEWEIEYRKRLKRFKQDHGDIRKEYWCKYRASAVVLTAKALPRRPGNLWRRDEIVRMHSVTDWRTAAVPEVNVSLHLWQTLAIKATEILRHSSQIIVLEQVFEGVTRLLAFADREPAAAHRATPKATELAAQKLTDVLTQDGEHFRHVENYYLRAGSNSGRIVYFRGMLNGAGLCAIAIAVAAYILWKSGEWSPSSEDLLASVALGALGAIVSVMTRMASSSGFDLDFEVGRKSMRRLGSLRPWIGATLALPIYLALKGGLLQVGTNDDPGTYFYATIAFVAGFSERRAKVLLDGVGGGIAPVAKEPVEPKTVQDTKGGAPE